MKKLIAYSCLLVIIAFIAVVVYRNKLVKVAVVQGTKLVTGMELTIGDMDMGFLSSWLSIDDLRIFNPSDVFAEPLLASVPKVSVDYELKPMFEGRAMLETAVLHIEQINVVKNKDNQVNIDYITNRIMSQIIPPNSDAAELKAVSTIHSFSRQMDFHIQHLELKIQTVAFMDYSIGDEPYITKFPINIHEKHDDITGTNMLVSIILLKAFKNTALASLTNFDLIGIQNTLDYMYSATLRSTADVLKEKTGAIGKAVGEEMIDTGQKAGKAAGSVGKRMLGSTEKSVEKAAGMFERLKEKTGSITESIENAIEQ